MGPGFQRVFEADVFFALSPFGVTGHYPKSTGSGHNTSWKQCSREGETPWGVGEVGGGKESLQRSPTF